MNPAFIHKCRTDLLTFIEGQFASVGKKFLLAAHHIAVAGALEKVVLGKTRRLIINIPPRYGKTEMLIQFAAWSLGLAPDSEFISASYSKRLSTNNNFKIKAIVESPFYRAIFPNVKLLDDSKAKDEWRTDAGGIMFATSCGGSVTGYGCGKTREGWGGAMILDDILKADEANSDVMRGNANEWFMNTAMSRLNSPQTPIVIIAQRLHEDDVCGFLLDGGNGEYWTPLIIPALNEKTGEALWEFKHTADDLERIKRTDPYNYASQYAQTPSPAGGGIFKDEWWKFYDVLPVCDYRIITADTAQKTGEHNDYSVFQCWGVKDNAIYLIDMLRGKWEAPDLRTRFIAFWHKHFIPQATVNHLRTAYVEDASSGSSLIQELRRSESMPIFPIKRNKDKVTRAMDGAPYIASGRVYLPSKADWLADFLSEFSRFTPLMTHAHDDCVDAAMDGIQILLSPPENASGVLW